MTVTNLQTSWPVTVNTWTYPQLLPVGLNLDGLEQAVIEAGTTITSPDHYQGLDIPPGHRIASIVAWTFTVTVNSKATKAFLFIQGEATWVVTSSQLVADDGAGNFGIGCTSMSPPTGPGLPVGTTEVVVTPVGSGEEALANYGGFPGLFGFGRWHFTAGGTNATFTVPDAAEFVFESLTVEYTTEPDPAQVVWHAVEAGDSYVAPDDGFGTHAVDLADPSSIPQPVPCDLDAGEGRWVMLDIEVSNAGDLFVRQDSVTATNGSLVFEDTPDEANVIAPASTPPFSVGVDGRLTFVGSASQRAHWFTRNPQEMGSRVLFELSAGLAVTSLDVWYERQLDPPVALFTAIPDTGPAYLDVAFDASTSYDPTATCYPLLGIQTYEWDFDYGAGPFVPDESNPGPLTSHVYTLAGVYTVALRVTDGDGQTDMILGTVTVTPHIARWYVGRVGASVPI